MPPLISCESICKSYGQRQLFTGISFGIFEGDRFGLIGPNGSGKSTFLKIIAGLERPDEGEITLQRQIKVGYVPQEEAFPEGDTVEAVLHAALRGLPMEMHERNISVDAMLGRLGFSRHDQHVGTLSGGWKKRLAIARALIVEPEVLLLDEPTNHLDLEGILWLETLLSAPRFAYLMVSHDRYLLNSATNRIIEINRAYPGGSFCINGNYSAFLQKRDEFLHGQASRQQALTAKVRQEIEWLQRGARARSTKARGRIEAAGRLIEELDETKDRNDRHRAIDLEFDATGRRTQKLLVARDLTKSLGGRVLFTGIDVLLTSKMKLGLLGPNGSGKTTLLRMLSGDLEPDEGSIWRAEGLRIVRFKQDRADLDKTVTLREALSPNGGDTLIYRGKSLHVTAFAKKFLFQPEQLVMQVSELSGGEQSRILIARMMLEPADLLILDEPTNDLDIPSLEVLEDSLDDFPGTVVLVTHDRYLMDRLCTELLAIDGKGGHGFFAEYAQWERQLSLDSAAVRPEKPATRNTLRPVTPPKIKLTWKEKRELAQMEESILEAETEMESALLALQDPRVYSDHQALHNASERHHAAEEQVRRLYARWEELDEKRRKSLDEQ